MEKLRCPVKARRSDVACYRILISRAGETRTKQAAAAEKGGRNITKNGRKGELVRNYGEEN